MSTKWSKTFLHHWPVLTSTLRAEAAGAVVSCVAILHFFHHFFPLLEQQLDYHANHYQVCVIKQTSHISQKIDYSAVFSSQSEDSSLQSSSVNIQVTAVPWTLLLSNFNLGITLQLAWNSLWTWAAGEFKVGLRFKTFTALSARWSQRSNLHC